MNPKLIEGALGMVARLIPPEEYAKAQQGLRDIATLLRSLDARLQRIEEGVASNTARVDAIETIVRNNVPGASAHYAEQALWMVPGSIEAATAPACIHGGSSCKAPPSCRHVCLKDDLPGGRAND